MSTPAQIEAEHRGWLNWVSLGLAKRRTHGRARPLAPIATPAVGVAVVKCNQVRTHKGDGP